MPVTMNKIKIIAGTAWAILCLLLVLALFPGLLSFAGSFSRLPFMKLNPNYSGGEVVCRKEGKDHIVEIRKPVFDGLTGERKTGFIQVDWRGTLPPEIRDTIDYDADGHPDFCVCINTVTAKTETVSLNMKTGEALVSTATSYGWAVRVKVKK